MRAQPVTALFLAAISACAAPRAAGPATPAPAETSPVTAEKSPPEASATTSNPSDTPQQRPVLVVIDPGHGGVKIGARNRSGAAEKDITLAVSLRARDALKKAGVNVLLTRESDVDISLGRRARFANEKEATLFVSIHANSWPEKTRRGIEVYILAASASDSDAAHVEAQEESFDRDERPNPENAEVLDDILDDLAVGVASEASALLALRLEANLSKIPALAPGRGLRQARFAVLRGAQMPAALVELGYLTHEQQGAALATSAVAEAAGAAVARGIQDYLEAWKNR